MTDLLIWLHDWSYISTNQLVFTPHTTDLTSVIRLWKAFETTDQFLEDRSSTGRDLKIPPLEL